MSTDPADTGQDPDADPQMKQSAAPTQQDQAEGEDDSSETAS
ncbi:hypothetical protein [Mycobacterium sp. PS03-16]|nr:hypothetical protein [Mycobacterium sp. PS03-16]